MFEEYFGGGQALDYDEFANQMYEQGLQDSPSLLHGAICGVLVASADHDADYSLAAISSALELELLGGLAELSLQLVLATRSALEDEEFNFQLFLPADEAEMAQRLAALGDWCRGFMAAYALGISESSGITLGDELADVLRDMSAIADVNPEVDAEGEDEEEDAEHNFFNLIEYLRIATVNLFMDRQMGSETS